MPSAVRRLRSQSRQKGAVVEAMTPKVVPSARRKRSAGAAARAGSGSTGPNFRSINARISACDTTCSRDQRVAPPTSMYSMNRTSAPAPRAYSSNGSTSSSLNPRMTTAFSLTLANPAATAEATPASTSA